MNDREKQGREEVEEPVESGAEGEGRFPELERLQQEIERQIRGNRQFLERFLDEDYQEEDEGSDEEEEPFEEL